VALVLLRWDTSGPWQRTRRALPGISRCDERAPNSYYPEAFAMVHATDDEQERDALGRVLLAYAHAAHTVAHQIGYEDLAASVEDRIQWIASFTNDPAAKGFAAWMRTTSIMRDALYEPGLRLLGAVRGEIDPGGRENDAALLATGSLHLRSSLLAGRAGDLALAMDHVEEARQRRCARSPDAPIADLTQSTTGCREGMLRWSTHARTLRRRGFSTPASRLNSELYRR
jgi:hypothetical protein